MKKESRVLIYQGCDIFLMKVKIILLKKALIEKLNNFLIFSMLIN